MREYTKAVKAMAFKLLKFYRENPIISAYELLGVELAPIQAYILNDMWFKNYCILTAGRGCGKALSLDAVVRIENGWLKIREINLGDYVFGSDGKLAKVSMISPLLKNLSFYKVIFEDGREIECCEDHLWKVKDKYSDSQSWCVRDTSDILTKTMFNKHYRYCIPTNKPIANDESTDNHQIHPYIVGMLFNYSYEGDGIKVNSNISRLLPEGYDVVNGSITRHAELYNMLMENQVAHSISDEYIYSSIDSRFQLLKGLLDNETAEVSNISNGVKVVSYDNELLDYITTVSRSLGIVCKRRNYSVKLFINTINGIDSISDLVLTKTTIDIVDVVYVGIKDGKCIKVDNDDNTYITKDYIVTHNSFLQAVNACLMVLLYPGKRVGLIGSSFRQAKTIFNEVDRIYQMSSILQQASERKPINGTDMCLLKFKPAGRYSGTRIAAIPLGNDGGKIRGERFHVIAADEFAQIPESIFNLVIKPMAATASDPMERAKRVARAKRLKALGITPDDDEEIANKIVMSSSGYYKTNHMWGRMRYYWSRIRSGDERYSVMQLPYWLMPDGFLDETNIEEARETLPNSLFEMEYCGLMVSDTDGFYKASLLEACTANTVDNFHTVIKTGDRDKEYLMAIDPAREKDSFAILIFEVTGSGNARIVYAKTYDQVSSVRTAQSIFKLRDTFNITRIIMDSQGGGANIRDLLEEGIGNNRPILNIDDKNNFGRDGDLILELFNPSPKSNTAANYTALSMLEHKRVWFPAPPQISDTKLEDIYDNCVTLKKQIVGIVTTPVGAGYLKFESSASRGKKDLYSCFIMGCHKIQELYKESFMPDDSDPVLDFSGFTQSYGGSSIDGYYNMERDRPLIIPGVKTYG